MLHTHNSIGLARLSLIMSATKPSSISPPIKNLSINTQPLLPMPNPLPRAQIIQYPPHSEPANNQPNQPKLHIEDSEQNDEQSQPSNPDSVKLVDPKAAATLIDSEYVREHAGVIAHKQLQFDLKPWSLHVEQLDGSCEKERKPAFGNACTLFDEIIKPTELPLQLTGYESNPYTLSIFYFRAQLECPLTIGEKNMFIFDPGGYDLKYSNSGLCLNALAFGMLKGAKVTRNKFVDGVVFNEKIIEQMEKLCAKLNVLKDFPIAVGNGIPLYGTEKELRLTVQILNLDNLKEGVTAPMFLSFNYQLLRYIEGRNFGIMLGRLPKSDAISFSPSSSSDLSTLFPCPSSNQIGEQPNIFEVICLPFRCYGPAPHGYSSTPPSYVATPLTYNPSPPSYSSTSQTTSHDLEDKVDFKRSVMIWLNQTPGLRHWVY